MIKGLIGKSTRKRKVRGEAKVSYVAEHDKFCKDKNRYIVIREVKEIVNRRGAPVVMLLQRGSKDWKEWQII
jgi:hypothetical protein